MLNDIMMIGTAAKPKRYDDNLSSFCFLIGNTCFIFEMPIDTAFAFERHSVNTIFAKHIFNYVVVSTSTTDESNCGVGYFANIFTSSVFNPFKMNIMYVAPKPHLRTLDEVIGSRIIDNRIVNWPDVLAAENINVKFYNLTDEIAELTYDVGTGKDVTLNLNPIPSINPFKRYSADLSYDGQSIHYTGLYGATSTEELDEMLDLDNDKEYVIHCDGYKVHSDYVLSKVRELNHQNEIYKKIQFTGFNYEHLAAELNPMTYAQLLERNERRMYHHIGTQGH